MIEAGERTRAQAELDPAGKLISELKFAQEDFKRAREEFLAGNIESARELTRKAVQASITVMGADLGDVKLGGVEEAGLKKARAEAEKRTEAAAGFAREMQAAAQDAIPPVLEGLETMERQMEAGKATLAGVIESIKLAKIEADELKKKLSENTFATHTQIINTVNTGGNGGLGLSTGGGLPGYGGGDKIPIMAEAGEHMIRKEAVRKLGRDAAHAFNRGDIKGLIQALPVQHLKEGGEVKAEGTTNVNLLLGEKAFPMVAKVSAADEFVKEIKSINIVHGRKKHPY